MAFPAFSPTVDFSWSPTASVRPTGRPVARTETTITMRTPAQHWRPTQAHRSETGIALRSSLMTLEMLQSIVGSFEEGPIANGDVSSSVILTNMNVNLLTEGERRAQARDRGWTQLRGHASLATGFQLLIVGSVARDVPITSRYSVASM